MRNYKCEAHKLKMEKIGSSVRGIPEYICSRGCKREQGEARVKKVFADRGFGFLELPANGDLFFHVSNLNGNGIREVSEGDMLSFTLGVNERNGKLQAINLEKLRN